MVILGLGSNVEDRLKHLAEAVDILAEHVLAAVSISPIYESDALLKSGSPEEWNKPFLNMVITGDTHMKPLELLNIIKRIEHKMGRNNVGVWSPREIDIDILAYGDECIESDVLTIPHKDLCKRDFALLPLADVAPNWQYTANGAFKGKTAFEISNQLFGDNANAKQTSYELDLVHAGMIA